MKSPQSGTEVRHPPLSNRSLKLLQSLVLWGLATLAFGAAYTQSILYEGNQNTKFLHGLAGYIGYLKGDWLARTIDPLPAFTYLIKLTYPISQNLFYVYYILLMGVYLYSILGIVFHLFRIDKFSARLYIFAILLILHSRWFLVTTLNQRGIDLEFLHSGVAGQYLLGLEFQNSAFGVFLLLSMLLFLRRKFFWSIIALSVANVLHSAYLFSAGLITLAYLLMLWWEKLQAERAAQGFQLPGLIRTAIQPFLLGLLALVFVIPVLAYNQAISWLHIFGAVERVHEHSGALPHPAPLSARSLVEENSLYPVRNDPGRTGAELEIASVPGDAVPFHRWAGADLGPDSHQE